MHRMIDKLSNGDEKERCLVLATNKEDTWALVLRPACEDSKGHTIGLRLGDGQNPLGTLLSSFMRLQVDVNVAAIVATYHEFSSKERRSAGDMFACGDLFWVRASALETENPPWGSHRATLSLSTGALEVSGQRVKVEDVQGCVSFG